MDRFEIEDTGLAGLSLLKRKPLGDERGFFERLFCQREFASIGFQMEIRQVNHSYTKSKGSVRGLHFQYPPHAETKIVSCLSGAVFDVAVDLRKDSSTYLGWFGTELSAENGKTLCIPEGFAHGFQTLTDDAELVYLHSEFYEPGFEDGLNPLEPEIAIEWPLKVSEVSARDKSHPSLQSRPVGIIA